MTEAGAEQGFSDELAGLIHGLWRAVVRATRVNAGLPELSEQQVMALQKLARLGPLRPSDLARELHLARPTVSNLLRDLVEAGLVERRPSGSDGRSALLFPTELARQTHDRFVRGRYEMVRQALAQLPEPQADALADALPSLRGLLQNLESMVGIDPAARHDHSAPPRDPNSAVW